MGKQILLLLRIVLRKLLKAVGRNLPRGIYYFVPGANWSIDWDGYYITSNIAKENHIKAQTINDPRWLIGQLIHYGSLGDFLGNLNETHNKRNKIVVTVFHGNPDDNSLPFKEPFSKLLDNVDQIDRLIVANRIMEERFLVWGVESSKIARIPLGVDMGIFKPTSAEQKLQTRAELGIAQNAFCIGSFQKDGNGWDEGLEPKLVKGPDIFLQTVKLLGRQYPNLFILLSAPARGYIKNGLEELKISYCHKNFSDYREVADLYPALDAYLITSREEGGPKGILEAMASGVPLVSTRVGMAEDVAA